MDALEWPGNRRQILPRLASSAAQIRMQSADSLADRGESAWSCGWHTIHSPFTSIAGNNTQNASLRSINRQSFYHSWIATKKHKRDLVPFCGQALLLMSFHVVHRECLQRRACKSQFSRFRHCAIDVPFIDERPFYEPHGCGSIPTRTVNKRRFGPCSSDGFQELINRFSGRFIAVERDMDEPDARFVSRRFFSIDVGSRLGGFAQIDDRCITHLFDLGH